MKKEKIVVFIVIVGLLSYLALTLLSYLDVLGFFENGHNSVLVYLTNAFTGLVGGIVASGFGVKNQPSVPVNPSDGAPQAIAQNRPLKSRMKYQNMGRMAAPAINEDDKREKLGALYTWSYIIVGVITCCIAIYLGFNKKPEELPSGFINQAYTFVGMVVAIITMYLSQSSD